MNVYLVMTFTHMARCLHNHEQSEQYKLSLLQIWKENTRISRISNSVTHLRSYTNTTIAGNSAYGTDITTSSTDVAALSATSSAGVPMLHREPIS